MTVRSNIWVTLLTAYASVSTIGVVHTVAQDAIAEKQVANSASQNDQNPSWNWKVAEGEQPDWVRQGVAAKTRREQIAGMLDRPMNAAFQSTTLQDLIDKLNKLVFRILANDKPPVPAYGFSLDILELGNYGFHASSPVEVDIKGNWTVRQVLVEALRPLELTWRVEETGFVITTNDDANHRCGTRVYDVACVQPKLANYELSTLIQLAIHPVSWSGSGGESEIRTFGSALFISAPEETHHEIECLLYAISKINPDNFAFPPRLGPSEGDVWSLGGGATSAEKRVATDYQLYEPNAYARTSQEPPVWLLRGQATGDRRNVSAATLQMKLDNAYDAMSLVELASALSKDTGRRLRVISEELNVAGVDPATPVLPPRVPDLTVRQILQSVLSPLECTWVVTEAGLDITTQRDAEKRLDVRCYDLASVQNRMMDLARLRNAIVDTCWPDHWIMAGGDYAFLQVGSAVVVAAPENVHFDVQRLLVQLKDIHPSNFIEPVRCFSGQSPRR